MKTTDNELNGIIVRKVFQVHTDIKRLRNKSQPLSESESDLLLTRISDELFFILFVNGRV